MLVRFFRLGGRAASYVPNLLVLLGLAGIAVWGYASDWSVPSLAELSANEPFRDATALSFQPNYQPTRAREITLASAQAVQRSGIESFPAKRRSMEVVVSANGSVEFDPLRVVRLSARAAGFVWRMGKQVGDPVSAGEVLAFVEAVEVGRAKAELLGARVQLDARTLQYERLKSPEASRTGAVPERTLLDAETAVREARVRYDLAQQALRNLGLPLSTEELASLREEDSAKRLPLLGLPPAAVRTLKAVPPTANLLPVIAPFAGEVVSRNVVRGETVAALQPLLLVADPSRMVVILDVRLEDASRLQVGQAVRFWPNGVVPVPGPEGEGDADEEQAEKPREEGDMGKHSPNEADAGLEEKAEKAREGRIDWISPTADPKTRTIRVRVPMANADRRLKAQTFGAGQIVVRRIKPVAVPASAVQHDGEGPIVFVRVSEPGITFRVRPVKLGVQQGDWIEVKEGLEAGEFVVGPGSHVLKTELLKDRLGTDE